MAKKAWLNFKLPLLGYPFRLAVARLYKSCLLLFLFVLLCSGNLQLGVFSLLFLQEYTFPIEFQLWCHAIASGFFI